MPDPESTPPRAVRIDPAVYRCLARAAAAAGMSRAKLGRALVAHGLRALLPDGKRLDPEVLGHVLRDAAEYAARIGREETTEQTTTS